MKKNKLTFLILASIMLSIFPEINENDDLFFIVLLSFVLLFFIWELRGTTGLSNNFKRLAVKKTQNEILYVFLINILFAFLFTCLISGLDLLMGFYDPSWVTSFDIDSVDISAGAFLMLYNLFFKLVTVFLIFVADLACVTELHDL